MPGPGTGRIGADRYAGVFAGIGGPAPKRSQTWRTVTCPREACKAGPQVKCRRRVSEQYTSHTTTGVVINGGEGRWEPLKHPHPERVRLAGGRIPREENEND